MTLKRKIYLFVRQSDVRWCERSGVNNSLLLDEYQRKDRLVYCDLIEHTILHVLITQETSQEFGYPGYLAFLKPRIEEWYLDKRIPKPEWMKNCYYKSFLIPEEAVNIYKRRCKKN